MRSKATNRETHWHMPAVRKRTLPCKPTAEPTPRRDPFPERVTPQLATLAKVPPSTGEWIYEIKFDGYRVLARLQAGQVRLFTRNGNDWTDKMRGLAGELEQLPVNGAWLDGEAVVLNEKGVPDFNALQNAFDRSREQSIVYFVFDVLYLDDEDLRQRPQAERTAKLRELLATNTSPRIRLSEAFDADGASALASACAMGLEGLIAKRLNGNMKPHARSPGSSSSATFGKSSSSAASPNATRRATKWEVCCSACMTSMAT